MQEKVDVNIATQNPKIETSHGRTSPPYNASPPTRSKFGHWADRLVTTPTVIANC